MKTLTIILLIAANSFLAAQTPPNELPTLNTPTPAPTRRYSGGINHSCVRNGQGPVIKNSAGTDSWSEKLAKPAAKHYELMTESAVRS